jgi:hypothetical protein
MTDEELDLLEQFGGSSYAPLEQGSARIIEGDRVTDAFGNPRDKVNMADIGGVQRGGKRTRKQKRTRTRTRKQKTRRHRRHTKQRKH